MGPAGEAGGEDSFDLIRGVQPFDDFSAVFTVLQAAVDLEANWFGEAGDFSDAAHGVKGVWVVLAVEIRDLRDIRDERKI